MTKENIDEELVGLLAKDIGKLHKSIMALIPKSEDKVLKHLSASAFHIVLFMKDFYELTTGEKTILPKGLEDEFLNECGCNNKDIK